MSEKKERYRASEEPVMETYRLTKRFAVEVIDDEWLIGRAYVDSVGDLRVSDRTGWRLRLTEADVAALVEVYQARDAKEGRLI